METIALAKIRTDGGTQMRVSINTETMLDYRDKWKSGVAFDPIDLFFDGATYWLADGFHRFYGAREAKRKDIPANIHNGSVRDAILFACGANTSHGLRRSNADKRQSVKVLLEDEEWAKWSDRVIAEKCGVSNNFVGDVRGQLSSNDSSHNGQSSQRRKGKDGKSRPAAKVPSTKTPTPKKEPSRPPAPTSSQEAPTKTPLDHLKYWWSEASETQQCLFRDWIERTA